MDEDLKTRFDWVENLRKASWESYCRRREYEWKISLGLWGALLALLAILLKREGVFCGDQATQTILCTKWFSLCRYQALQWSTAVGTVTAYWFHVGFMRFIRQGHFIDQTRHEDCLEWQRKQAGWSDVEAVDHLVVRIKRNRDEWRSRRGWRLLMGRFSRWLKRNTRTLYRAPLGWGPPSNHKRDDDGDDLKADVLIAKWMGAHRFQMGVTALLGVAINLLLWLNSP